MVSLLFLSVNHWIDKEQKKLPYQKVLRDANNICTVMIMACNLADYQ